MLSVAQIFQLYIINVFISRSEIHYQTLQEKF